MLASLHCILHFSCLGECFLSLKIVFSCKQKRKSFDPISFFVHLCQCLCLFVCQTSCLINFRIFFFRFRFRFTPDKMICKTKRKIHYLFIMFEFFFCSFLVMFIFPEIQKSKINLFSLSLFESIQRPLN